VVGGHPRASRNVNARQPVESMQDSLGWSVALPAAALVESLASMKTQSSRAGKGCSNDHTQEISLVTYRGDSKRQCLKKRNSFGGLGRISEHKLKRISMLTASLN